MKQKIFNSIIVTISIFVLIELLVKKSLVYSSIMNALSLWVYNLLPSLFPFFIISDILINYNITSYIPKIIKNFCKRIFNITDNMLTILILSMISGFPSNARNTRALYDRGLINTKEANHILMFSHFANPIFILTTIAVFFFHNEKVGVILLITHYLSNIILGIFLRNKFSYKNSVISSSFNYSNFGSVLVTAIKRAVDTILTICGIIVVFLMLATIIINTFKFNSYNQMIIKGIFEITIGIEALSKMSIGINYKLIITSMILAFGGISVHVQVLSQIAGTKIKYIYFFVGRMYQMIIAGILTYLWIVFIKI